MPIPIQVTINGTVAWVNGEHFTAIWETAGGQSKLTLLGMKKEDALDIAEDPTAVKEAIEEYLLNPG